MIREFGFDRRRYVVHGGRVILFIAILSLIRAQYGQLIERQEAFEMSATSVATVGVHLTGAHSLSESGATVDRRDVFSETGDHLGYILQTSPYSDHIVGFSGPTNLLLIFDTDKRLTGADILSSADTPAHVKEVESSESFWAMFEGRSEEELAGLSQVDGVSGATLTSTAIYDAIVVRLGGKQVSLRFPKSLELEQAQRFFPNATSVRNVDDNPSEWIAFDTHGVEIGRVLRTSPSADAQIGYQGPTDTLIGLDPFRKILGIWPGASYDNDEYVGYIRVDDYFLNYFDGMSIQDLSTLDLEAEEIEGVSGATMTSMAMARGLLLAATSEQSYQERERNALLTLNKHDAGTVLVVTLAMIIGLTSLRGNRWVRVGFPFVLIGYLGLINGDMLSLAMISGWARHGIPVATAPSLVLLSVAALLIPITSRNNLYCHHMCPHGAAQQLLRRVSRKRILLSSGLSTKLKQIPGALLICCVLIAMTTTSFSLVDVEPFDAWVFRVAGAVTIAIAIVGLLASLFVPMAYCRFGCPTGRLLNFLRLNAHSDKWTRADWMATGLLLVSICIYQLG